MFLTIPKKYQCPVKYEKRTIMYMSKKKIKKQEIGLEYRIVYKGLKNTEIKTNPFLLCNMKICLKYLNIFNKTDLYLFVGVCASAMIIFFTFVTH